MMYYRPQSLFAVNRKLSASVETIGRERNRILIIDNLYAEPEHLRWLALNTPAQILGDHPETDNFKSFVSARISMQVSHEEPIRVLQEAVNTYLGIEPPEQLETDKLEIFVFKNIDNPPLDAVFHPRFAEFDHRIGAVAFVFLNHDDENSGGFNFYRNDLLKRDCIPPGEAEHFGNLLQEQDGNVSDGRTVWHENWDENWSVIHQVPARFNRAVIFPRNTLHGPWVRSHDHFEVPRIDQLINL